MLDTIRANELQGLLHPAARLPRLRRARRQPAPLPGRRGDPGVGMGRLPRRRRAREGRRRQGQLVDAHGAEHVPGAGQDERQLRQLAADQDGSDRRRLHRRHRARHATATSAKAAARTSSSSATACSTRRRWPPSILPGHHARLGHHARARPRLPRARGDASRARCSTSPTRCSSSARPSRSRRSARSTRSSSAPAARPDHRGDPAGVLRHHQRRRARHARLAHLRRTSDAARPGETPRSRPSAEGPDSMHVNDLLKTRRRKRRVRPAPEGRQLPDDARRAARLVAGRRRASGSTTRTSSAMAAVDHVDGACARSSRSRQEVDLAYSVPGPRPLPLQRVPAARHRRPGAPRHPDADPDDRRAGPAAGPAEDRRGRARPGPRHRHDRQRQEHHARGDDRPHQPARAASTS